MIPRSGTAGVYGDSGEYRLLYQYLRNRYADRVVLTFSQIEDLLGFPLPAPACRDREWWDEAGPLAKRPTQSDAWTLANRAAKVNLLARTVLFELDSLADKRPPKG